MAGKRTPRVGVLALQGDVREHRLMLASLGAQVVDVKREQDLLALDGLVIPGGESSVIDKLARGFGLFDPLRAALSDGLPVLGTCAGLIMLASRVVDAIEGQQSLGILDIDVRRNAFGAQVDSFETEVLAPKIASSALHATFIRAPIVERVGTDVEVLATLDDGRIVGVAQGNAMGISFHPEVSDEPRVHEYFLSIVSAKAG